MKQMLKPKAVPTLYPEALTNCSPPPAKRRRTAFEKSERSIVSYVYSREWTVSGSLWSHNCSTGNSNAGSSKALPKKLIGFQCAVELVWYWSRRCQWNRWTIIWTRSSCDHWYSLNKIVTARISLDYTSKMVSAYMCIIAALIDFCIQLQQCGKSDGRSDLKCNGLPFRLCCYPSIYTCPTKLGSNLRTPN